MRAIGLVALTFVGVATHVSGQSNLAPRTQRGFFISAEAEAMRARSGSTSESGSGGGVSLGYQFGSRWTGFAGLSQSSVMATEGGTYSLAHIEVGGRAHILGQYRRVLPFFQFGVVGSAASQYAGGSNYTASGGGISLGAGAEVNLTRHLASSVTLTRSVEVFGNGMVNGMAANTGTVGLATIRSHIGLIWFP